MNFPAPPIRTPVIGNPPKSQMVSRGEQNDNVHSYPWIRWFQNVSTQLTAPVQSTAPATSASAGTGGQIAFDANFLYVCIAKNTWKRTALVSF